MNGKLTISPHKTGKTRCNRLGITLIEVMIGASVLAMLFFVTFRLFSSFSRTQEMGHWSATTTKQLRNGLTLLRNELSRATRPEIVTQKGSESFDTGNGDREHFLYLPAAMPFETETITNQKLLHFYMCRPGRSNLPGESDIGPEILAGSLYLENGKLIYRRAVEAQPADFSDKISALTQVVSENISKISMSVQEVADTDDLSVKNRNILTISLTARHPRYQNSTVTETIEATFEVKTKLGGHP